MSGGPQELQEAEAALREALRDHEETAGSGRSQAFSLQRQLEAEKEQRLIDISRTTQTHASLLSDATASIKRLEVPSIPANCLASIDCGALSHHHWLPYQSQQRGVLCQH